MSYIFRMMLNSCYSCPLAIGQFINEHVAIITSHGKKISVGRKGDTTSLHKPR